MYDSEEIHFDANVEIHFDANVIFNIFVHLCVENKQSFYLRQQQ